MPDKAVDVADFVRYFDAWIEKCSANCSGNALRWENGDF